MIAWLVVLVVAVLAVPVRAELALPPGFTSRIYVTGQGFDRGGDRGAARGIPVATTLGFDRTGALYLPRSGSRYLGGEVDELLPIYRIPVGGAQLTPESEGRYAYGPPLRNPEVGAVGGEGHVFVTSYDRDRQIGALYRTRQGRPELFAGGTPPAGTPPLFRQPEGVAVDTGGNVYVADRALGRVVKLDPRGRILDATYASVLRARALAIDDADQLWIGGDGSAERPWQDGAGQIWRVGAQGRPTLVLEGPVPTAIGVGPGGALFVAQRQTRTIFVVTPDGRRIEFARFEGDLTPRALAFAPSTPETRRAGIAGQLFVVTFVMRTWYLNEVIQVSGPFDEFVRPEGRPGTP